MSNAKVVMSQAANTLVKPLNVEDVFSTYLYTGNASTQTITNGIDLDGEGGLVWVKGRSGTSGSSAWGGDIGHTLFDSSAPQKPLNSALTNARTNFGAAGVNFTSTGFTVGYNGFNDLNYSTFPYVSWTFRKAPKFFDVVTYTGDGTTGRTISHNLGSVPGVIIVKRTDNTSNFIVHHKDLGINNENNRYLRLNTTDAEISAAGRWNDTFPSSTDFTLGTSADVNSNGGPYVAYLFAHNDGDGGFGPDGDADIIKCGSYTGNGSTTGPEIDLGFEPQWLLVKRSSTGANWLIIDNMRGFVATDGNDSLLYPNLSNAEASTNYYIQPTPTGFQPVNSTSEVNANGSTYIYIAIRRGTKVPESGTEVFDINTAGSPSSEPSFTSGFVTDMSFNKYTTLATDTFVQSRMQGPEYLKANANSAATAATTSRTWDYMDGWGEAQGIDSRNHSWMWKRAPGYCDVVAYTGAGAGTTFNHNLGVAPEMIWVKNRSRASTNWNVYHKDLELNGVPNTAMDCSLFLNLTSGISGITDFWGSSGPSDTQVTLGTNSLQNSWSGDTFVAYLFASLDGISKVGSASHSGTTNVDCGFTSGSRFVLLKRTDASGDWYFWDSLRGIVSGNDPYLLLNTNAAQVTNTHYIGPLSSGFTITSSFTAGTYIFYAIA